MEQQLSISDLLFTKEINHQDEYVLHTDSIEFLSKLVDAFLPRRDELLKDRIERQKKIDDGKLPDFILESNSIKSSEWKILNIPADLCDRRVEITGPVERKMVINALNSNVKVFMADFEDSLSPSWSKLIEGQINLKDAIKGDISYTDKNGKVYQLQANPAVLIARVRGLHLNERHVLSGDIAVPGGLFDFAIYFYNNYQALLEKGSGPYFYIPKLESWEEAKWWSDVFSLAEDIVGIPRGTIKATVLIETLPAAFQMDEILYHMRHHIVALNCGRWDYIFSYIKTLKEYPDRVLPDRQVVTMTQSFLSAYSRLLIKTCHRRGALAMGGMSAFIPSKDIADNEVILAKVKADKQLEAMNGHDGSWIAHPGLADTVMDVFNQALGSNKNQLHVLRDSDAETTAAQLLAPSSGERTDAGMRANIRVAVQYIEAWITGNGCVPIYGLMEDAATAEISRTSIWQWIRHEKMLSNGEKVTKALFEEMLDEELQVIQKELGDSRFQGGRFREAAELMHKITTQDELIEFLTIPGYQLLD